MVVRTLLSQTLNKYIPPVAERPYTVLIEKLEMKKKKNVNRGFLFFVCGFLVNRFVILSLFLCQFGGIF